MTIEVEIDGRIRSVSIEARSADLMRSATTFSVVVDGWTSEVEVTRFGSEGMSLLVGDGTKAAPRSVEALVAEKGPAGDLSIVVGDASIDARVFGKGGGWGARKRVAAGDHGVHLRQGSGGQVGTNEVTAPMPGRIARVLVAPGDAVKARQPLVVVEAMKMENELRARAAARVKDVLVAEGALVEAGRVLVVLEQ